MSDFKIPSSLFSIPPVLQPQMQSIMTSPQLQPLTIQHQRVLTQTGQTIQTLSTAPTTVHTVQQQMQQVPVSNAGETLTSKSLIMSFYLAIKNIIKKTLYECFSFLRFWFNNLRLLRRTHWFSQLSNQTGHKCCPPCRALQASPP